MRTLTQKTKHPFRSGDKIHISGDFLKVLIGLGMNPKAANSFSKRWANCNCEVLHVWSNDIAHWVTVDLCCEVPAQCCTIIP